MTDVVFIGPTLRPEEVAAACDAMPLPPVAQGDVYRAARRGPSAIGIVDGFFSGAPSVWHKEILWAMSQGIRVYGSASMGALRAAELHSFGMRGVGRIFEAFRDGILEDDDEVAVVHGPAELGFAQMSEPMVNIRATLALAEASRVLSPSSRRILEGFGKSLFFPHRSWAAILERACALGVPDAEVAALSAWLPKGCIDQKREDALEMLAVMREPATYPVQSRPGSPTADYRFEWTHFWDELVARNGGDTSACDASSLVPRQAVIEELRLEGEESYRQTKMRALLRAFAGREARRQGAVASPDAKRAALTRVRAALRLFTRAELDAWMARNHLEETSLERLRQNYAQSETTLGLSDPSLDGHMLDELRLDGLYEGLAARAREKLAALAVHGVENAAVPDNVELRLWYFAHCVRQPMPEDLADFARELGYSDLANFDSALRREWLYSQMKL